MMSEIPPPPVPHPLISSPEFCLESLHCPRFSGHDVFNVHELRARERLRDAHLLRCWSVSLRPVTVVMPPSCLSGSDFIIC